MTRGRQPKPETLAWLSGNRKRIYKVEPNAPDGAPICPDYLDAIAKQEWIEITSILSEMGLLSKADKTAIEFYCESYSRFRKAQEMVVKVGAVILSPNQKVPMINPYHTILRQAEKDCTQLLLQFGLTPSARARMGQDIRNQHDKLDDPFAGLIG